MVSVAAVPLEISLAASNHVLVASAAANVAVRVNVALAEFAKSTRTSNGVDKSNEVVECNVFVTFAGTEPPYIRTVPKGNDAVLVVVPVTAKPLASVTKVKLIDPWTVPVTPRVPEPV